MSPDLCGQNGSAYPYPEVIIAIGTDMQAQMKIKA